MLLGTLYRRSVSARNVVLTASSHQLINRVLELFTAVKTLWPLNMLYVVVTLCALDILSLLDINSTTDE